MKTLKEIVKEIRDARPPFKNYIYILHEPDGTPFYIGKGGKLRVEQHEKEAKSTKTWKGRNSLKISIIRSIWSGGGRVLYSIDSWHLNGDSANNREVELITSVGRTIDGKGPLANITKGGEGTSGLPVSEETRKQLSAKLKKHFADNPEVIEKLQAGRRRWVAEHPEEYADARRRIAEYQQDPQTRQETAEKVAAYFRDHPEAREEYSRRSREQFASPEARERDRQSSIDLNTQAHIRKWQAENPEEAARQSRENLARANDAITDEVVRRRNESIRSEKNRRRMSEATRLHRLSHPETEEAKLFRLARARQAYAATACRVFTDKIRDLLVGAGLIAAPTKNDLGKWCNRQWSPDHPRPHKRDGKEEWQAYYEAFVRSVDDYLNKHNGENS